MKDTPKGLNEIVEDMLTQYKLKEQLMQTRVRMEWKSIVGDVVARHTLEISFFGDTLYVNLDSASLRKELGYHQERLIEKINQYLQYPLIRHITIR